METILALNEYDASVFQMRHKTKIKLSKGGAEKSKAKPKFILDHYSFNISLRKPQKLKLYISNLLL